MTLFICLAALLAAGVAILVLRPLWQAPRADAGEPAAPTPALNILREQRHELDMALASGELDANAHAQAVDELAQRVLDETTAEQQLVRTTPHRTLAWLGGLGMIALSALLYVVLGNPGGLDPARREPQAQISMEQIAGMVDKLAAKVAANPDDAEGILMLARSYMMLGRFAEAAETYAKLAAKQPDNPDVIASWADALSNAQGGKVTGEPEKLIARALKLDPEHVKALALAGTAAFEQGRFQEAASLWEKMASHVDPQSETGQSAQVMIAEARKRAGGPTVASAAAVTARGVVKLSPSLQAKVAPSDVVFIFARPAAGGPPLAALRYTAADLPIHFDFSQAQMMMSGGHPDKIVIGAKISKSGNATPSAGDLEGATSPIQPDSSGVEIVIDKQR